jgi:molybdopterin-guanine dinucleotide biosynthesis protein A
LVAFESPTELSVNYVTAAVLAGGGSTRFGSDKALAKLPGEDRTFLERAVSTASVVAGQVLIVAPEKQEYRSAGARILPDLFPGEGPAGGVLTALRAAMTEWLLVLSCDQPFVEARDLEMLLFADHTASVTTFRSTAGGFHPLPCAIRVEPTRSLAESAFAEGCRSLRQLLRRCGVTTISIHAPENEQRLLDIDSPTDLPSSGMT